MKANFENSSFEDVDLSGADIRYATFSGADFSKIKSLNNVKVHTSKWIDMLNSSNIKRLNKIYVEFKSVLY